MRSVLLLSGGVDSTVLAYRLASEQSQRVHAISFRYNQRNGDREIAAATRTAALLHMRHSVVPLSPNIFGQSALTGYGQVPALPVSDVKGTAPIVLPGRNLIFLAMAAGVAAGSRVEDGLEPVRHIYFASHTGDIASFPDCRPEFVDGVNKVFRLAGLEVTVLNPLAELSKKQVVEAGHRYHVNWLNTYSCYVGKPEPCGICGACRARSEAFKEAELIDPADPHEPRR